MKSLLCIYCFVVYLINAWGLEMNASKFAAKKFSPMNSVTRCSGASSYKFRKTIMKFADF